jgi:hypothetical protein
VTGQVEVLRALAVLSESPDPAHARVGEALELGRPPPVAEHTEVFGMLVVPYAAVYLGAEGMLGGEAADRVAGFWRAVGHVPPAEPDHLAALLGLYVALAEAEESEPDPARRALRRRARSALLWEHVLTWVPVYARAVAGAGSPYYAGWAALLTQALAGEAAAVDPPGTPAQHLRDAPGLPEGAGAKAWAQALLSPVSSGLVLTRRDLAVAAREQGLGLRVGERAFVVRSMLEQDAAATFGWLAGEADRWAGHHSREEAILGPVARFWKDRAEATAAACRARRDAVQEVRADAV